MQTARSLSRAALIVDWFALLNTEPDVRGQRYVGQAFGTIRGIRNRWPARPILHYHPIRKESPQVSYGVIVVVNSLEALPCHSHKDTIGREPGSLLRTIPWLPLLLWCLIVTTFASFRDREIGELIEFGGVDWQVKFQAVSCAFLGLVAIVSLVMGRADTRLLRRGPLFWYVGFVVVALFSASYAPAPSYTAYRAAQHGIALVLVISLREHLQKVYVFIVAYVAVNWILVILGLCGITGGMGWISSPWDGVMVSHGFEQVARFSSAFGHPSIISILAGAAAAGLAFRTRGRAWVFAGPVCALLACTTLLTVSRTAILGMAGAFAVVALGRRRLVASACFVGFVLPLPLILPDMQEAAIHYFTRGQTQSDLQSLTGRVPAYQEAMHRIAVYWPLGQGFQAGRFEALDSTGENVGIGHAHNWLLESAYSMGLLGAIFTTLVLVTSAHGVWRVMRRDLSRGTWESARIWEPAAMLVPLFAYSILDSGFVTNINPVCMLFVVVASWTQTIWLDGGQGATDQHVGGPEN